VIGINATDGLHEVNVDGQGDVLLAGTESHWVAAGEAAWSPDRRYVAFAAPVQGRGAAVDGQILLAEVASGCWWPLTKPSTGPYSNPTWSPDSGRVAYVRSESGAPSKPKTWLDITSTDGAHTTETALAIVRGPRWSPDASGRIAFVDNEGLKVVDPNTGNVSMLVPAGAGSGECVAWSTDGTRLAIGGATLRVVRSDGTDLQTLLTSIGNYCASWSPDGTKLAYTNNAPSPSGGNETDLRVIGADGRSSHAVTSSGKRLRDQPLWSNDGQRIAYEQATDDSMMATDVMVVDLTDGRVTLVTHGANVGGFSGSLLAVLFRR
jgi:Tol biopolymer transport system component